MACKSENMTPLGVLWRRVRECVPMNYAGVYQHVAIIVTIPGVWCVRRALHTKQADGIVVQDHERFLLAAGCAS